MQKGVLAVLAGVAVFVFVAAIPLWYLLPTGALTWLLQVGVSGWVGWKAGNWVLHRGEPGRGETGLGSAVLVGALVVGTAGFLLGFLGPMIFTPGANQGPLLGIFITGPLGFVAGGLGGAVVHARRRKRPT